MIQFKTRNQVPHSDLGRHDDPLIGTFIRSALFITITLHLIRQYIQIKKFLRLCETLYAINLGFRT
jgi:hypothetical protein